MAGLLTADVHSHIIFARVTRIDLDKKYGSSAVDRVPTPPGKFWIVRDFFLENSRTWKLLKNHFGPIKSWKHILEVHAFF